MASSSQPVPNLNKHKTKEISEWAISWNYKQRHCFSRTRYSIYPSMISSSSLPKCQTSWQKDYKAEDPSFPTSSGHTKMSTTHNMRHVGQFFFPCSSPTNTVLLFLWQTSAKITSIFVMAMALLKIPSLSRICFWSYYTINWVWENADTIVCGHFKQYIHVIALYHVVYHGKSKQAAMGPAHEK